MASDCRRTRTTRPLLVLEIAGINNTQRQDGARQAPSASFSMLTCRGHDARGDVNRDPVHVAVGHLHLAGVQAGADVEPEVLHRVPDRARAVIARGHPPCEEHTDATGRSTFVLRWRTWRRR